MFFITKSNSESEDVTSVEGKVMNKRKNEKNRQTK